VPFGIDRIKSGLGGMSGLNGQQICNQLLEALMKYQHGAGQDDDVTLVAIHRSL
jgi:serine phosphatase RsbU (regulator of sigma subunit)